MIEESIGYDEKIIWRGRKRLAVSVLEAIFNRMLPLAILWGMMDMGFIISMGRSTLAAPGTGIMLAGFFALHLMPVWIYLGGVITSVLKSANTEYALTDKGIYIQSGIFSKNIDIKPLRDISRIVIKQGLFDRMCNTGDVVSVMDYNSPDNNICNIKEYEKVFQMIRELLEDINEE